MNPWTEGDDVKVITKDREVLDVVEKYPDTQLVFEQYDDQAGECICCNALFRIIEEVAERSSLDLKGFLEDINKAVSG